MKPNHCAIVTDEGPDVHGKASGEIMRHGICALWEPNEKGDALNPYTYTKNKFFPGIF